MEQGIRANGYRRDVPLKKKVCAISRSVASPLGVVEVIHTGLLHGMSTHTFPLYLVLASDYYSDVCLLFFYVSLFYVRQSENKVARTKSYVF